MWCDVSIENENTRFKYELDIEATDVAKAVFLEAINKKIRAGEKVPEIESKIALFAPNLAAWISSDDPEWLPHKFETFHQRTDEAVAKIFQRYNTPDFENTGPLRRTALGKSALELAKVIREQTAPLIEIQDLEQHFAMDATLPGSLSEGTKTTSSDLTKTEPKQQI